MRTLIATDAWFPQVNGVVNTLDQVTRELRVMGHSIAFITSKDRRSIGLPSYPEIRLAYVSQRDITQVVEEFRPDSIHIATEGPIGISMRRWCVRRALPFTTGFHTRFPEYLASRIKLPGMARSVYALLRRFHKPSEAVLVPTPSMTRELSDRGFERVQEWTRGIDHTLFQPSRAGGMRRGPGPVMIYAGRVAVEKGLQDFLDVDVPGTKVIVGDGPAMKSLKANYPDAIFTGYLFKEDLASELAKADVFVFPSRTDTFGLVMLEAMACGLPVAAYPVPGPVDIVEQGISGWLDTDLKAAILHALTLDGAAARARAMRYTWTHSAHQFQQHLVAIKPVDLDKALL